MRIELTEDSPVKKTMVVELEADLLAKETDAMVRQYGKHAKIPGFRKGKVPLDVVRTRFAKEVEEEVRDRLLSRCFQEATAEKGLRPIGDPKLDDLHFKAGEPFRFTTTFEVFPEFEVKNYREIEARRPKVTVGEDEIDKTLEEIRQSRTQLETREGRKAGTGDVLVADVEGAPDEGEAFQREAVMIELGASNNLPEFNEQLDGVEAGDAKEFWVEYPEDFQAQELAGTRVGYKVKIHEVKEKVLPGLDDEFAKDLGDFGTLDELRGKIREDIEARKNHETDRDVRQRILDKVLLENPIALPELLVDDEVKHRLEDMVRQLMQQGMDPEQLDLDWKELRQKQEEPARKAVHARLVLEKVAVAEKLKIDNAEVEERVRQQAVAMGEKPAKLLEDLKERKAMQGLAIQLLREKSLDLIASVANIQNEE
ncbi:MAG: trigger factor [bacterium]|nr:trigger factor [bacterium]